MVFRLLKGCCAREYTSLVVDLLHDREISENSVDICPWFEPDHSDVEWLHGLLVHEECKVFIDKASYGLSMQSSAFSYLCEP